MTDVKPLSRETVLAQYADLCKETGDLYFQLEFARQNLAALEDRMTGMKRRRDDLQAALTPVPAPTPSAEAASDVNATMDGSAGV